MATFHVYVGQDLGSAAPVIRKIGLGDLRQALAQGIDAIALDHLVQLQCAHVPPANYQQQDSH